MGGPGSGGKPGQSRQQYRRPSGPRFLGKGKGAAIPTDGKCARCHYGEEAAPCTCIVEDRCSNRTDSNLQCIKGASHRPGSQCVTAAGRFFR